METAQRNRRSHNWKLSEPPRICTDFCWFLVCLTPCTGEYGEVRHWELYLSSWKWTWGVSQGLWWKCGTVFSAVSVLCSFQTCMHGKDLCLGGLEPWAEGEQHCPEPSCLPCRDQWFVLLISRAPWNSLFQILLWDRPLDWSSPLNLALLCFR